VGGGLLFGFFDDQQRTATGKTGLVGQGIYAMPTVVACHLVRVTAFRLQNAMFRVAIQGVPRSSTLACLFFVQSLQRSVDSLSDAI